MTRTKKNGQPEYKFYKEFRCNYAPAWLRAMLERKRRARIKQALKAGEELPIYKKDAGWHYS